jgi:uncharacterized protein (TIGR00297 family)
VKENLEIKRKIIHIFFGLPVILYGFIPVNYVMAIAIIAIGHNLLIAPFYMRSIFKKRKKIDIGIVLYPIAVLLSIIIFKDNPLYASFLWLTLSFGDGFSGLIGIKFGKMKLRYNSDKTVEGFLAGFISSFTGMILIYLFLKNRFPQALNTSEILLMILLLSLSTSFVETLPLKINDNITVPITGFIISFIFINSSGISLFINRDNHYIFYSILLLLFAISSYIFKFLNLSGSITAFIIGFSILILSGIYPLGLLIMFFILSVLATKFRYEYKEILGIGEENNGIRGLTSVIPKGIIPLYASLLIAFHPNMIYFKIIYIVVIASALFDTVSSEIGKGFAGQTFSLLKFRKVYPGERGGISIEGVVAGFISVFILYYIGYYFNMVKVEYLGIMILTPFISNILEPYFYYFVKGEKKIQKSIVNSLNLLSAVFIMIIFIYL